MVEPPSKSPHVLVVEDDPTLRDTLVEILRTADLRTSAAADGREGLAAARELAPDLILTGFVMPQLNGFELIEALEGYAHLRAVPVILLSALARPPRLPERVTFVRKPFDIEPFLELVLRLVGG